MGNNNQCSYWFNLCSISYLVLVCRTIINLPVRGKGVRRKITEMWWDGFCDWSVAAKAYRLLRKDRQGR